MASTLRHRACDVNTSIEVGLYTDVQEKRQAREISLKTDYLTHLAQLYINRESRFVAQKVSLPQNYSLGEKELKQFYSAWIVSFRLVIFLQAE